MSWKKKQLKPAWPLTSDFIMHLTKQPFSIKRIKQMPLLLRMRSYIARLSSCQRETLARIQDPIVKLDQVEIWTQDPKLNFLTLSVLGLRILFLKTIVFNVLMTVRVWMR
ncbi:hypothetical protein AALO_G00004860 [Alosa alosa]|uniref:Uncharacterized protein n=1 Tax=Alosa alosa TaxID=278164 RepID=A0AAV6HJ37_9TELE|nr:hypothetical protein AALO_G00004860 [Alosa alosa]